MKKVNYKKILIALLWIFSIGGIGISLAFVSKSERNIVVREINVAVYNNDENLFLTEKDVKEFLAERNEHLISNTYKNINVPQLERVLNSHPAIENAEVSADINGQIKIEVTQRTPVCRIINMDGESYYIDSQSKLMPLSDNYSARVIVASGNITEPYARRYQFTIDQIKNNETFSQVSVLDDVLDVVKHINSDTLLASLIHHVYVNAEKEIELLPAIGDHKIIFGSNDNVSDKFNKLKLFYTQGLNKSDSWNKYSTINLKYKNLVVCTKK